jgi:hypothetical protein
MDSILQIFAFKIITSVSAFQTNCEAIASEKRTEKLAIVIFGCNCEATKEKFEQKLTYT